MGAKKISKILPEFWLVFLSHSVLNLLVVPTLFYLPSALVHLSTLCKSRLFTQQNIFWTFKFDILTTGNPKKNPKTICFLLLHPLMANGGTKAIYPVTILICFSPSVWLQAALDSLLTMTKSRWVVFIYRSQKQLRMRLEFSKKVPMWKARKIVTG